MKRKAIYSQLWETSGKYPVNKRRSNNQESKSTEFSVGRGCTSQRAQENGCHLPLVSNFYLVKAKHWNLPVISQEQEKGEKKSLKNILSWVGCQGWNQEHRSLLKETKLGRDEKGWKSWVTSEGIKDADKLWNIVSQPSSGKWAQTLSMHELSILWRVSMQGREILYQQ